MPTHEITPAGVTDTGNVRTRNEDYLLAGGDLFVVADGMGGHGHGDVASRMAVETLQRSFASDPTERGLIQAVHDANEAVMEHGRAVAGLDPGNGSSHTMGTTVAAVAHVVEDGQDRLVVVNVGDSRVYLFTDGELHRLTEDHSLVADLVRAGTLSEEEAETHHARNVLTQAIGVTESVEPHVTRIAPSVGDRLLLCSDGLFNDVGHDQLTAALASGDDPELVAARLVAEAKANGGSDNITALVLDLG